LIDEVHGTTKQVYLVPGDVTANDVCLGITVHPLYPVMPYFYAYCTRAGVNHVPKLTVDVVAEVVTASETIFSSPSDFNDGGPLHFGPDGKLYLSIGDGNFSSNAQDLSNNQGKYVRMNDDGSVPSDNPWKGSLNYLYGVRNSFGFAWDPKMKKNLWGTDNGPECNDEVNLYVKGANYGWGANSVCPNTNNNGKKIHLPKYEYPIARGTVGTAFDTEGNLLNGSFDLDTIDVHILNKNRNGIAKTILGAYQHPEQGSMLTVQTNPVNKDVYFSTISGIYVLAPKKK